jgi:TolB-like protein
MKKFPALLALFCLALLAPAFTEEAKNVDAAFPAMARQLSAAEPRLPKKTVAVYGFEVIGRPGDSYALYATEKLTHELVSLGKLLVIERSRLEEVLKEQNFSLSGMVDAGTAARIGKLLSVDAVVIGTVRVTPGRTEFIARIIQSETGIILASADEYVLEDEEDNSRRAEAEVAEVTLSASKTRYKAGEEIVIKYSGLPGNEHDWITLVPADQTDDTYGEWFYTDGEESGSHSFAGVSAGDYEVRVYFDWPAGGYEVQKRIKVTVK